MSMRSGRSSSTRRSSDSSPAGTAPATSLRPPRPSAGPGGRSPMEIHLLDGTYELFRHFFAVPSRRDPAGQEIGAVGGVLGTVVTILEDGATHVGVATDHVIESFRNDL